MKKGRFVRGLAVFFKILVILALCFELVYLSLAIFNRKIDNKFKLYIGNYGVYPYWLEDSNTDIDALYDRIPQDGEFAVAYAMYRKACEKLMLVPSYGVRAISSIDVTAGSYELEVASNRTEQYRVAGIPQINANQKVFSSYTNTIYITDVNDDALATILKGAIQFADRGYSDGTDNYKQKGTLSVMDDEGEVITWATEYAPEEITESRTYKDDDIKEKCNFIVNPDTILPDSVSIEREYDEEKGLYLYKVNMSLDCSDNSEGSATYYEAKAIGDVLGKNMKSLLYSKLDIEMTLYSNGYLITWDTEQEWTLSYEILFLKLSGTALNKKCEVFSYDPRDCEVIDFTALKAN